MSNEHCRIPPQTWFWTRTTLLRPTLPNGNVGANLVGVRWQKGGTSPISHVAARCCQKCYALLFLCLFWGVWPSCDAAVDSGGELLRATTTEQCAEDIGPLEFLGFEMWVIHSSIGIRPCPGRRIDLDHDRCAEGQVSPWAWRVCKCMLGYVVSHPGLREASQSESNRRNQRKIPMLLLWRMSWQRQQLGW